MLLLTCEHASAALPRGVDAGIALDHPDAHVLWDPLAHDLALGLALRLGAPLLAGQVSRVFVDLNRRGEDPAVIPTRSFGRVLPLNADLSEDERQRRIAALHAPFRRAVLGEVVRAVAGGGCQHLSVHSFSPVLDPAARTYAVGLLFDPARPAEQALADALADAVERAIGQRPRFNQPYAGTAEGLTTWLRERWPDPTYAGIEVELNQGLAEPLLDALIEAMAPVLSSGGASR